MTTLIDRLAGIAPGSELDSHLAARAEARAQAERSYQLLLHPADPGPVSLAERHAIAAFVAELHDQPQSRAHYSALLGQSPLATAVLHAARTARTRGPYGHFPPGPLSVEDLDGPLFQASSAEQALLGPRLSRALEQAHLLILHPRDATPADLQRLLEAGWSTAGIVVLSQLVAFLSFQIRVIAGLRAVAAAALPLPV